MTATGSNTDSATKTRRPLPWPIRFYQTDVGKKYVMAITGIVGLGFLVAHMLGNLHAFQGASQLNEYAEGLRDLGEPLVPRTLLLWLSRLGLIAALILHFHAAVAVARTNKRARGTVGYDERTYLAANYASRTMLWSGIIVLAFIVWHLADLTIGVKAVNQDFVRGEVYANVMASLERWPVFILYVVAQGALALHVWHGAWSLFQSVGISNPRFNKWRRNFATALASTVAIGYLTVPFGILFGVIH